MPAGGLFSTASDLFLFYRMLANNGACAGTRILSEKAVAEMTRKQTADTIPTPYGLGINADGKSFGHGGAYNTSSRFRRETGLLTVFLGQHGAWPPANKEIQPAFEKAAAAAFSPRASQ